MSMDVTLTVDAIVTSEEAEALQPVILSVTVTVYLEPFTVAVEV